MMRFTWDPSKSKRNKGKRGFGFEDVVQVFFDRNVRFFEDGAVEGEERIHAIGMVEELGIVLVVHTVEEDEQGEHVRIISARLATSGEKQAYREGL